ncbi:hypothetical protein [Kitasatospora sp. GP82]|uniref:hypothetical protein n=1 Tax=Kitasatospora sp. GP82 TaxID=3035089 RepID=UPI0024737D97|nr:hypothetical protein [Kitasatospora sp. GP82]MDH6128528.1 hypothetical protein [Kitasatospora sp. GP82]
MTQSALGMKDRHIGSLTTAYLAAALALLLAMLGLAPVPAAHASEVGTPPSDGPRSELRHIIEDVTHATGVRYQAKDSAGRSMDSAKIIQDSSGSYLAVYHAMLGDGRFHAAVATSTDLLNWTFVHDFGPGSSQPTITQISNGGYVMAWEQDPSNHIAVRYYPDRTQLLSGNAFRSFDSQRTLSRCAEGTPNIYDVQLLPDIDHSAITIGGHYYANCNVDQEMKAHLTNFSNWSTTAENTFDNAMLYWGVRGNIGDRDAISYKGFPYGVVEGQYTKSDFRSWRVFLYDYTTLNADTTAITTTGGSIAFANPHITSLKLPDGHNAVFVSLFLPNEGAAPGEAGQLIYYRSI